jgi:recA bacterial DNA recombination protein
MAKFARLALSALHFEQAEQKFAALPVPALLRLLETGLSRGIIAEVNGRRSTGRTSACLHILAQATARGEICAVIDLNDSFHPASAAGAAVELDRVLWVRCRGNAEHAIRAADLLLHAGGFGVVLLDLCEASARTLNRIPLSYWYRFRRAVEHTPAILLICADAAQAKSCASTAIELRAQTFRWSGKAPFLLLRGIHILATMRRGVAAGPAPACSMQAVV